MKVLSYADDLRTTTQHPCITQATMNMQHYFIQQEQRHDYNKISVLPGSVCVRLQVKSHFWHGCNSGSGVLSQNFFLQRYSSFFLQLEVVLPCAEGASNNSFPKPQFLTSVTHSCPCFSSNSVDHCGLYGPLILSSLPHLLLCTSLFY